MACPSTLRREAVLAAIDQGLWQRGAKLPTESEFVAATPSSLGTVQRAMRELAEDARDSAQ